MGEGALPDMGEGTTPPPAPSSSPPSPPAVPTTAPASSGTEAEIVPGVDHALFVQFVVDTGSMDIPIALAHAQQKDKYKDNKSFMDWLMRPGTNIWRLRQEMLKK